MATSRWVICEREVQKGKIIFNEPRLTKTKIGLMADQPNSDIYTQKQREYVDSIPNSELRSHLLHQVRLRDNMEADRDSFEKRVNEMCQAPSCMKCITSEMRKDKTEGSYYYSWQANIAMAFYDEVRDYLKGNLFDEAFGDDSLHTVANNSAKRVLDLLIHVSDNS